DPARDLAHRQRALPEHVERAAHAHLGEVGAEAGLARLGERPLELAARRGEPARDVVELEVGRVLALDDLDRLLEERAPPQCCSGSYRHVASTSASFASPYVSRYNTGSLERLRKCRARRRASRLSARRRSFEGCMGATALAA